MLNWQGNYCGPAPLPDDLLWRWNVDPVVLGLLVVLIVVGGRRGAVSAAVLGIIFVSPLCALASALFAARVVHHVLLVAVAAPLLAGFWPARGKSQAALAFLVAVACLWLWHAPVAYDAALGHKGIYWVMQGSLLTSWVWFWRVVFAQRHGAGAAWVMFAYMAMGLLGALLTFAPEVLYAAHGTAPLAWGLLPLADQQLGGLIMWVPAGVPFAIWIALLLHRAWDAGVGGVQHDRG